MNCLALTERRQMDCDGYLFPAEYYDIPGLEDFQDLRTVKDYVLEKMKQYQGKAVNVYLNGGMTIETLTVIQAAARLDIQLNLQHYDFEKDAYVCQLLSWRPGARGGEREEEEEELVLCQGRHWGGEKRAVFQVIPADKLFDFHWQEEQAGEVLKTWSGKKLKICVSGLTSAAVSVMNAAARVGVSVVWLHYDYDTEEYFPQDMDRF